MRIPFPEHVPIEYVIIFVGALVTIQLAEGTALYFSLGCAAFILIAAIAFNLAGGLTRASGAYVFFYSMMVVIIGICYKAVLREPAQSHLQDPRTDIKVYLAGITAMLATVIVSRRFLAQARDCFKTSLKESKMYRSSIGCMVIGGLGQSAIALLGESGSALMSAFNQLNEFIPLGIIIGAMYEIRHTGGRRSSNLLMILGGCYSVFLGGVLAFSKQGFLTAPVCWLLAVSALGFKLSARQVVVCCAGTFLLFHYLVPYAQYGRGQVRQDMPPKSKAGCVNLALNPFE